MSDHEVSPALRAIMNDLADNFDVSDEDYQNWKVWYESLQDYEKVDRLLGAISQYLTTPCNASASVMASAIVCTNRWTNEKADEDF
jgi:oligoendopeptidase F